MNNTSWHCRRCGQTVDMIAFRCGCTESPSPWEPVLKSLKIEPEIFLWEVGILPNNQPEIILGKYYAINKEVAMEMAAVDNQVKVDECFFAEKVRV